MQYYLGIDFGEKRIGLSYADEELGVAVPLPAITEKDAKERWQHLQSVVTERHITVLVVGYPYARDDSNKKREIDVFIQELKKYFSLPIHFVDEELTTYQVQVDLAQWHPKRIPLFSKKWRWQRKCGEIDSRAATLILQSFLNALSPV